MTTPTLTVSAMARLGASVSASAAASHLLCFIISQFPYLLRRCPAPHRACRKSYPKTAPWPTAAARHAPGAIHDAACVDSWDLPIYAMRPRVRAPAGRRLDTARGVAEYSPMRMNNGNLDQTLMALADPTRR